jgi:hypothetical protein
VLELLNALPSSWQGAGPSQSLAGIISVGWLGICKELDQCGTDFVTDHFAEFGLQGDAALCVNKHNLWNCKAALHAI